jgi:Uma2 family endonuclease
MARLARRQQYSFTQYLELEEASNTKHEYFEGEIYAMAGGTPEHAAICAATTVALGTRLRAAGGACRVFSSDLRVRVAKTGLCTYPDVSVVCHELVRDPESHTTVVNPALLVEVLSDSTEAYDRGEKLEQYQQIPSLAAILLVSHRERRVDVFRRDDGGWLAATARGGDVIALEHLGCSLPVDEIYDGIL